MRRPAPEELRAYALGELGPEAARRVEAQLRADPEGRAQVVRWRQEIVALVEQGAPVPPPPRALTGILARTGGTSRARPVQRPVPWMLAAGVAALVALLSLGWGTREARTAVLARAEQRQVAGWLAHADVRILPIQTRDGTVRGRALLLPGGRALFVLPQGAPPGKTFQAWGARHWKPGQPLTPLAVSERATFEARYDTDQDYLCVTLEPAGGSATPTLWVGGVFL